MIRRLLAVATCLTMATFVLSVDTARNSATGAPKATKKPLTVLKHDPTAEQIELFEGIDAGKLSVKLIPKNAFGGNVLVENLTDKPLTVKLPEAVVGVPKHLAQFGGMGGGMGGMGGGMGGMGGGMGGMGGGMGGGMQSMGGGMGGGMGGMGGGMGGMGGGMGGGGGFFGGGGGFGSIPPESVASFKLTSVCLEHGKPDPVSSAQYVLVPVDRMIDNPQLVELLKLISSGRVDPMTAQAATWHLTDRMSFVDLANKVERHAGGRPPTPYFTQAQLLGAANLLAIAKTRAEENPPAFKPSPAPRGTEPGSRVSTAAR